MSCRRLIIVAALVATAVAPAAASADPAQRVQLGPLASPVTIGGGTYLIGAPIRPGTVLPAGFALVSRTLTLGDADPRDTTLQSVLTCPPGMYVAGLFRPHPEEAEVGFGYAPGVQINRSTSATINYSWDRRLPAGATFTPATVCATLESQAILEGPVRSPYVVAAGRSLIGHPIRVGTLLPRTIALVTKTVTLTRSPARTEMRTALVSCPSSGLPGREFRVRELLLVASRRVRIEGGFTSPELPAVTAARLRAAHLTYEVRKGEPVGTTKRVGIVCQAVKS